MPITIDVLNDLESASALKTLLNSQKTAIFSLVKDLALYAGGPVSAAATAKVSSGLTLDTNASWTTSSTSFPVTFSFVPSASCTISFDQTSTSFDVAMSIEDPTATTPVVAGPTAGYVYVNIDLNFSVSGSISGSGTFGGVGIAASVAPSAGANFSFCHPVLGTTNTVDAIKDAFSHLVFPLDPECTANMEPGSIAKAAFTGSIACEVDFTYGLGSHQFSAPSVPLAGQALQNVVLLNPPSASINAGASASVTYNHTDNFAIIASKTSDVAATVYLLRSAENDWGASVGVQVGVTLTNASVTIDQTALATAATTVTGNATVAGLIVNAASGPINKLQSGLNAKLQSFFKDYSGSAGLSLSLSRNHGHTALFAFSVDLSQADLAKDSWDALVGGSVIQALAIKGFTLLPGSGVGDTLEKASTINFQFFNFYNTTKTAFFANAYVELGPDGTIRIFKDIGEYTTNTAKGKSTEYRIHFVATATEDNLQNISKAEVDLYLEFSETGRSDDGHTLANTIGMIPSNASVNTAQTAVLKYLGATPNGPVNLINIIKPSGYRKLSCSPYINNKPGKIFPVQDSLNWNAFRKAAVTLLNLGFSFNSLTYQNWQVFNVQSITGPGNTAIPDRRQLGNPAGVLQSFYDGLQLDATARYFFIASADFMNLCEDLTILFDKTQLTLDEGKLQNLTDFLTKIVTDDNFILYAIPTAGALLSQCTVGGSTADAVVSIPTDNSSLTCTVTLS